MEALDGLLESGTEFVKERGLAGEDGVSTAGGRLEQTKQGIRRRVHLVGVIPVPFSREVAMTSDVSDEKLARKPTGWPFMSYRRLTRHGR